MTYLTEFYIYNIIQGTRSAVVLFGVSAVWCIRSLVYPQFGVSAVWCTFIQIIILYNRSAPVVMKDNQYLKLFYLNYLIKVYATVNCEYVYYKHVAFQSNLYSITSYRDMQIFISSILHFS